MEDIKQYTDVPSNSEYIGQRFTPFAREVEGKYELATIDNYTNKKYGPFSFDESIDKVFFFSNAVIVVAGKTIRYYDQAFDLKYEVLMQKKIAYIVKVKNGFMIIDLDSNKEFLKSELKDIPNIIQEYNMQNYLYYKLSLGVDAIKDKEMTTIPDISFLYTIFDMSIDNNHYKDQSMIGISNGDVIELKPYSMSCNVVSLDFKCKQAMYFKDYILAVDTKDKIYLLKDSTTENLSKKYSLKENIVDIGIYKDYIVIAYEQELIVIDKFNDKIYKEPANIRLIGDITEKINDDKKHILSVEEKVLNIFFNVDMGEASEEKLAELSDVPAGSKVVNFSEMAEKIKKKIIKENE